MVGATQKNCGGNSALSPSGHNCVEPILPPVLLLCQRRHSEGPGLPGNVSFFPTLDEERGGERRSHKPEYTIVYATCHSFTDFLSLTSFDRDPNERPIGTKPGHGEFARFGPKTISMARPLNRGATQTLSILCVSTVTLCFGRYLRSPWGCKSGLAYALPQNRLVGWSSIELLAGRA